MIRTDLQHWDEKLKKLPEPTLLQTAAWATVKEKFGWQSIPVLWQDEDQNLTAAASVLKRQIQVKGVRLPLSMIYIPKGPILDWENEGLVNKVLADLIQFAKDERAFLIKIEPEIRQFEIPDSKTDERIERNPLVNPDFLEEKGWNFSEDQIQFRNSVLLDLKRNEDQILSDMKQKTRYNIRLAKRKGVQVREGTPGDFELIYKMYAETSLRDKFVIRSKQYYFSVWDHFYQNGQLIPLIAFYENKPLAALMLFHFHHTAYYIYGMSTSEHRNLMPTYLLQWEAITKAKKLGCKVYDLWGAPNNLSEDDPMWGVYRFKLGLGGMTVGTIGAWDFILKPGVHRVYNRVMPKVLQLLRKRGNAKTAESL